MPASVFAAGNTALITGGASGVGLAVAQLCRKHGMKLAIVDNNAKTLGLAKETLGADQTTETYEVDVSDHSQWGPLREKVQKTFGGVDLLMLNAGMQVQGGWENSGYFEKVIRSVCAELLVKLTSTDTGDEPVRCHIWHQHILTAHSVAAVAKTISYRHHRLKARHHQPTRQPGLQRLKGRR